jgi:hypothetical protein
VEVGVVVILCLVGLILWVVGWRVLVITRQVDVRGLRRRTVLIYIYTEYIILI